MAKIIFVVIFFIFTNIVADNSECEKESFCECSRNENNTHAYYISNKGVKFGINVKSWSDVQIKCENVSWKDLNFTREQRNSYKVDSVNFKNCPLPKETTLNDIVNQLGIMEMIRLGFQSHKNLRKSLTKEHFQEFPNVTELILSYNGLTTISSDFFTIFPNLRSLDLSENSLVLSNDNFNKTLNLKQLDLHNSEITELPLYVFHDLQDLSTLNLEGNSLETLHVRIFEKLISLKYLNLSSNSLLSLQQKIFQNLEKLETIDLSNNNFWYLPSELFTLNKNLKKILVQDNKDNLASLHDGFLTDLKNLEEVHMRNSKLKSLHDKLFTGTTSVKFIDWSENLCENVSETAFVDVLNTKYLNISHNRIRKLPDLVFQYFKSLEVLDLSYNRLDNVQRILLHGLTSLKELNMEGNGLVNIHLEAFSTNEQLSIAKFSNNRLQFSNPFNLLSPFFNNHLLKVLHLSNNTIKHFFSDWTTNKLELELLDLRHNDISTISANDFIFSSDKVLVNLEYNNISYILLDDIEDLVIYDTEMRTVIVHVENNPVLCDCHLYNLLRYYNGDMPITVYNFFELRLGNLTCVKPNVKNGLQFNLLYFKTYHCLEKDYFQIVDKHPNLCTSNIRPYDQTRIIDCSNKLMLEFKINKNTINLKGNYPLILNLTGNHLKKIPSLNYIKPLNLTHLLLSNNEIFEIAIDRLPKTIRVLELHNNNLVNLNYDVSEYLFNQYYQKLTLSGNPFECGCDVRFIYVLVLQLQFTHEDLRNVKCKDYDTPLGSLTIDELCASTDQSNNTSKM